MSETSDIIEMLCDEPSELRRVFGGLGELPALWGIRWCGKWVDEALLFGSRADGIELLLRPEPHDPAFEDPSPIKYSDGEVVPLTPAAVLADRKAGL